jgi:hypothetical protein
MLSTDITINANAFAGTFVLFFQCTDQRRKNSKELPSQRSTIAQTMTETATTERRAAYNN